MSFPLRQVLAAVPRGAVVVDVSARDGLQAWKTPLPASARARWVRALLGTGIPEVEAASFVSPKQVPQMAGAAELLGSLADVADRLWALVPNRRGAQEALGAGARRVVSVVSAEEDHSRANLGRPVSQAVSDAGAVASALASAGAQARAAVSMAWLGPEDGAATRGRVLPLLRELRAAGFPEVTLCDTRGDASPRAVGELLEAAFEIFPPPTLGVHLHDVRGDAVASALVALLLGVGRFDASIGGLGGCPFVPGARGNLATGTLIRLLHSLGVATGVDEKALEGATADLVFGLGAASLQPEPRPQGS